MTLGGGGLLCGGAHELSFNNGCSGGRVARSLGRSVRQRGEEF